VSEHRDLLREAESDLENDGRALEVARRYVRRADREGVLQQLHGLCSDYSPGEADHVFLERLFSEHYTDGSGPDLGAAAPAGVVTLDTVDPETVRWLWPDRIPLGKLTMLDGDPGLSKSTITLDLAARLSRGVTMPDGSEPEVTGSVGTVLLTAEDGLSDTVRPRLDAAGGDPSRVAVVRHVPTADGEPRLPHIEDTPELARALERVDARLLVVDPLMAFLPPDVNSHRDQDVRRALAPLVELADETGVAVVCIRHLNKSGGANPKYRGGGSIGLLGAARTGLLVAEDPDAPDSRRILAPTKNNLSAPAPSLALRAVAAENGSVRVEWEGESDHDAHQLLDRPTGDERSAREEAADILREELRNGPRKADDLQDVADRLGVSWRTVQRASRDISVEKEKVGGSDGFWRWSLPESTNGDSDPPKGEKPVAFGGSGGREPPSGRDGRKGDSNTRNPVAFTNGPESQGTSGGSDPKGDSSSGSPARVCKDCGETTPGASRCRACRLTSTYMAMPDPDRVERVGGLHPCSVRQDAAGAAGGHRRREGAA
jgi:hypothetical protein